MKNLNDDIDDDKLRGIFASFGEITSCKIMRDERNNSKGFGFVCYANQDDASKAVNELNGQIIGGKPIYVAVAQRKEYRKAQLERMRAAGANAMASSVYAQPGTPIFYQQPGVHAQLNPAAVAAAAAAGRGVQPPFVNQYIIGRGGPVRALLTKKMVSWRHRSSKTGHAIPSAGCWRSNGRTRISPWSCTGNGTVRDEPCCGSTASANQPTASWTK